MVLNVFATVDYDTFYCMVVESQEEKIYCLSKADLVILVSAFPSNMLPTPSPLTFGILKWSGIFLMDCL